MLGHSLGRIGMVMDVIGIKKMKNVLGLTTT